MTLDHALEALVRATKAAKAANICPDPVGDVSVVADEDTPSRDYDD